MQLLDTPPIAPAADRPAPPAEQVGRVALASLSFLLDLEEVARATRDHDLIDGLLFTAVLTANLTPILRDADAQLAYAALDKAVPEAMRRPVSISAIAHSLGMPFETVRRRLRGLVRRGMVADAANGVYVPSDAVLSPAYLAIMLGRHERLQRFYDEIRSLGVLPTGPREPPAASPVPGLVRITNRALAEYSLRAIGDLIDLTGDVVTALVLAGMVRENACGLPDDRLRAWLEDPRAHAVPIRTGALAERLGVSPETCRRYAVAMEDVGLCDRSPRGLIATAPPAIRARLSRVLQDNLANVQRLFFRLRQYGVLAAWDEAADGARQAI
jgi:DNA-binding Lrp family transcriptional regulator